MPLLSRILVLLTAASLTLQAGYAGDAHESGVYPSTFAIGSKLPASVDVGPGTTIIIRYLGYECSHCVRQLMYINEHAADLRRMGIKIIATSADSQDRWEELVEDKGLDVELFSYIPDEKESVARDLGALRTINDTLRDLHATIVEKNGTVVFSVYSDQPYMDIDRVVSFAAPEVAVVVESPQILDRYLKSTPVVTQIATATDGLREPLDLDFNRTALHPKDLWVVTAEDRGHAMTIIHNAGTAQQVVRQKKDSRANHFMWRTMGIAMGSNGAFGTTQNGEAGGNDKEYMFMGPTLWSSDTAVFASRYQDDNTKLASHLDMLHQSPWGLGIAHDSANIFWILDAKYQDICRYDFRDPHEVGGTDHRDGIIRRYSDVIISRTERGRPAHIALDHATGLLYFIDPGAGTVSTLDTKTGTIGNALSAPYESDENYAEYSSVENATVTTVISSGLQEPIGIDVYGNRLIVGDKKDGRIHLYAIEGKTVRELGTIATGATELHGIVVGPDENIWFVDKARAVVGRLNLLNDNVLVPSVAARTIRVVDTVYYRYGNGSLSPRDVTFKTRLHRHADGSSQPWSAPFTLKGVPAKSSVDVPVATEVSDSLSVWSLEIVEVLPGNADGISATTTLVPRNVRRAVVQDERVGTYNITEAVGQTTRTGYVSLTSDVFNVVVDSLRFLKTALWNSGSFGEIDVVDDAILSSLLRRGIEIFLIADDPLLLRTDLPNSITFFSDFGCSLMGVDQMADDKGQRVFQGVLADPVTAGMADIDFQLPRLDHHRGGKYVPNVAFRLAKPGSTSMMTRESATIIGAVRFQASKYRSIILGVNASRFLDGGQRTTILDKGLAWLEAAANPDTIQTGIEEERAASQDDLSISIGANPVVTTTWWRLNGPAEGLALVELYSVAGQRMASLYSGSVSNATGILDVSNLPSGSYFLVVRANDRIAHRTIIVK